ncbi:MAG: exosortase-associated EpsI family protein, partial [Verrucomicrobia bacterium]|nr:exosortase-associated EpsI family protein [Verrucomicrobiota bacterium]
MTTARLVTVLCLVSVGFSSVFALRREKEQPAGIALQLPDYVGQWYGTDAEVTQREREVLAADTQFARKRYTNGLGDAIFASIVLSGQDLDNSIHRPERCLPAQGMTIIQSSSKTIDLPDG